MAEGNDLSLLRRTGPKCRGDQSQKSDEKWSHRGNDDDLTNGAKTCIFRSGRSFRYSHTCWAHEKSAQTGQNTIRGAQVGCTLAAAIEDPQLMFDEHHSATTERRPPGRASRTTVT